MRAPSLPWSLVLLAVAVCGCAGAPASIDAATSADGTSTTEASAADAATADCTAQDAHELPDFTSPEPSALARYRWSGLACRYEIYFTDSAPTTHAPISPPTGCVGADCPALFRSEDDCIARYAACGAVHETPMRGAAFVGARTVGVGCGSSLCPAGQECAFEITENCRPPSPTDTRRLRCDDVSDCAAGVCCVGEDGPYVVSSCVTSCDPAQGSPVCSTDADCAATERCCTAEARYNFTVSSLGVCTAHACEPAS